MNPIMKALVSVVAKPKIAKAQTIAPLNTKPAGSNAQTEAYGKAMNAAIKNTKVFK